MQEHRSKMHIELCREIVRVRQRQIQDLVQEPRDELSTRNQISDALTQLILALSECIDDKEINTHIQALMKDYDLLTTRLGGRLPISEQVDTEEDINEIAVDEP